MGNNECHMADTRNVIDEYKTHDTAKIKQIISRSALPYAVLMEQWQGDFNIGSVIRNANAFAARSVYYIGEKKHYDKRGTVGTHHYTDVEFIKTWEDLDLLTENTYTLVGVDNTPGFIPVEAFEWPRNPLLVFGEESVGLTPKMLSRCKNLVGITQYGSVRSLNAAVASGIVMWHLANHYFGSWPYNAGHQANAAQYNNNT